MSNAGSPLRSTTSGSNLLYDEPCSPRRSVEILLRKSHPNDMGLTFPPQSDSYSSVYLKLESNAVNESVLEAVIARAFVCLRSSGNLYITLPKCQETSNTEERPNNFIHMSILQPHEVALLCKTAGFLRIQIAEYEQDYVITCSKV